MNPRGDQVQQVGLRLGVGLEHGDAGLVLAQAEVVLGQLGDHSHVGVARRPRLRLLALARRPRRRRGSAEQVGAPLGGEAQGIGVELQAGEAGGGDRIAAAPAGASPAADQLADAGEGRRSD